MDKDGGGKDVEDELEGEEAERRGMGIDVEVSESVGEAIEKWGVWMSSRARERRRRQRWKRCLIYGAQEVRRWTSRAREERMEMDVRMGLGEDIV